MPFAYDGPALARIVTSREGVVIRVDHSYTKRFHELPHRATVLHDLVSTGSVVTALFSTANETRIASTDTSRTRLDQRVMDDARRVAVTDAMTFVASDREVVDVDGPRRVVISGALRDIGASTFELVVVTDDGLEFFDARGNHIANQRLTGASAITEQRFAWAPRPDERRWIVAAGGDLLAVAGPGATPTILARGVGAVARVRASADTLHAVSPEGVLTEVFRGRVQVIATVEPGWVNFAHASASELHVDEGKGPVPFWADTRCGCRTRTVTKSWDPESGPGYFYIERATCPVCGTSWIDGTYEHS